MLTCAYESDLGERYPEATGTLIGWPLPRDPGASQGIVGLESNLRDGERLAKRKNGSGTGPGKLERVQERAPGVLPPSS